MRSAEARESMLIFGVFVFVFLRPALLSDREGETRRRRLSVLMSSMPCQLLSSPVDGHYRAIAVRLFLPARSLPPSYDQNPACTTFDVRPSRSQRLKCKERFVHLDVRSGDALVRFTDTLITADLGVLPLTLLHKCLELGIIGLGDGLGLHFDVELAACALDARSDVDDGLLERCDTRTLVQALAGKNVQRRGHQLDLDLVLGCVARLGASMI